MGLTAFNRRRRVVADVAQSEPENAPESAPSAAPRDVDPPAAPEPRAPSPERRHERHGRRG